MSAEVLLRHFDRISGAPNAILRLRSFILDLAVRGRLVEQSNEEISSSGLLEEIDNHRRLKSRERARTQDLPLEAPEEPFNLPASWRWIKFGRIHELVRGVTYSKSDVSDIPESGYLPILRANNIGDGLNFSDLVFVRQTRISEEQMLHRGDFLIALSSGSKNLVGKAAFVNEDYTGGFGGFCGVVRLYMSCLAPFVGVYVASRLYRDAIAAGSRGIGINNLKRETLSDLSFPLPCLSEQHRIVAKVKELMVLCDRLDAAQRERESHRNRLSSAIYYYMNTGADTGTLRNHAEFLIRHVSRITTSPDHVHLLRRTILSLAICGRLVPQKPSEGLASEQLKSITLENIALQKAKKIKVQKSAPAAENFEVETELPSSWVHAYLQDLAYQITDGTHLTPNYTEHGRPFLSAQNVKPFRFMPAKHRFVSEIDFEKYRSNRRPEQGDVLLTRVGAGIGEAAVLDSEFEFAFYVSLCLIKVPTRLLSPQYLVLWLNSPEGRESSKVRTYGKDASQGNLNLSLIRTFKVPVPPLAEQNRIVAKVDELMALCDQLEAGLTVSQTEANRLLESVLHYALRDSAPVAQPARREFQHAG
jgi:type I restriction enzyme S subunit